MAEYFHRPIFVLGLPRSGTSLVAGSLAQCGVWTGTTVGPSPENPRGFFEHEFIREHIVKRSLLDAGYDRLGVTHLPPIGAEVPIPELAARVESAIKDDGYGGHQSWLYKDAKLTLLWSTFKEAFPAACWVIVNRDEDEFVDSCLRTHFMVQHSNDPDFWIDFADEYISRLDRLRASGVELYEIHTNDIFADGVTSLAQLAGALGVDFDAAAVDSFINGDFWHGNQNASSSGSAAEDEGKPPLIARLLNKLIRG